MQRKSEESVMKLWEGGILPRGIQVQYRTTVPKLTSLDLVCKNLTQLSAGRFLKLKSGAGRFCGAPAYGIAKDIS